MHLFQCHNPHLSCMTHLKGLDDALVHYLCSSYLFANPATLLQPRPDLNSNALVSTPQCTFQLHNSFKRPRWCISILSMVLFICLLTLLPPHFNSDLILTLMHPFQHHNPHLSCMTHLKGLDNALVCYLCSFYLFANPLTHRPDFNSNALTSMPQCTFQLHNSFKRPRWLISALSMFFLFVC